MPWSSKEKMLAYSRKYRKMWFDRRDKVFGTKCIICGSTKSLVLHNIFGEKHPSHLTIRIAFQAPWKWRRLCYSCHKGVHWIMKFFGLTWEQIIRQIKD